MLCYAVLRPLGSAQLLSADQVDLIFRRANMISTRRTADDSQIKSEEEALDAAMGHLQTADEEREQSWLAAGDGGSARLVLHEFIGALVRVAWSAFPRGFHVEAAGVVVGTVDVDEVGDDDEEADVGERLRCFLQCALFPLFEKMQEIADPLEAMMESERVRAVIRHHDPILRDVFEIYARADARSLGAMSSMDTINLPELVFLMKEGKLLDDTMTMAEVTQIFSKVNSSFGEAGDDDNEMELSFEEFTQAIPAPAYAP